MDDPYPNWKKKQKTKMKKSTQVNNELPCFLSKKTSYTGQKKWLELYKTI